MRIIVPLIIIAVFAATASATITCGEDGWVTVPIAGAEDIFRDETIYEYRHSSTAAFSVNDEPVDGWLATYHSQDEGVIIIRFITDNGTCLQERVFEGHQ